MGCMLSICVMDNGRQLPQQGPEIENNYYRTPNNWPKSVSEIVQDAKGPFGKSALPAVGDRQLAWKGSGQAAEGLGRVTKLRASTRARSHGGTELHSWFRQKCRFWLL